MMSLAIYVFRLLFLIDLISATNDTDILVTYSIAVEQIETHTTTNIPSEYDTIYEIFIQYQEDGIASKSDTLKFPQNIGDIFAISTVLVFNDFDYKIFDTQYCDISGRYYNKDGLCANYKNEDNIGAKEAYGLLIGKPLNNDYNLNAITHSPEFTSYFANYLRNLLHSESFTITSVDIALFDTQSSTQTINKTIRLLDLIDIVLYIELYAFLAFCGILMLISKVYAQYTHRDDIQFVFFVYFIVFSLNFFANSMIFTLRLFEQQRFILGALAVVFLIIFRLTHDIPLTIKSKSIWMKSAFIKKSIIEWYRHYESIFITLSLISGPIGAITITNSRLFVTNIMFMSIPHSMIVKFIGDLFWKILFAQRLPELAIQITFVWINGYDNYALFAHITTFLSILLLLYMKLQLVWCENEEFLVQRTAFLMEISSSEINTNVWKYLLQPNAFKQIIAEILEIDTNKVELLSFDAINVSTDTIYGNVRKVSRCYGLKTHIAINTNSIFRRYALMMLEKAKDNDTLMNKIKDAWNLRQVPSIDEIVMVYDLSGDLVIQRAYSWDEATSLESIKLKEIQESNLQFIIEERSEYIATMQQEMEEMARADLEEDEDEYTETTNDQSDDTESGMITIYLNDEQKKWNESRAIKKIPKRMHIPDTSSILSMALPFDANHELTDTLGIQLQRVTSDSSIKSLVSV